MVRPSESSTVNVSAVTVTSSASGTLTSMVETIIPSPHESQLIFLYDTRYLPNLGAPQSIAALHPDRVQPELGDSIVTFNVHVWRFIPVSNVEEEAKRSMSQ